MTSSPILPRSDVPSDGEALRFAENLMKIVGEEMMGGNAEAERLFLKALVKTRRHPKGLVISPS